MNEKLIKGINDLLEELYEYYGTDLSSCDIVHIKRHALDLVETIEEEEEEKDVDTPLVTVLNCFDLIDTIIELEKRVNNFLGDETAADDIKANLQFFKDNLFNKIDVSKISNSCSVKFN